MYRCLRDGIELLSVLSVLFLLVGLLAWAIVTNCQMLGLFRDTLDRQHPPTEARFQCEIALYSLLQLIIYDGIVLNGYWSTKLKSWFDIVGLQRGSPQHRQLTGICNPSKLTYNHGSKAGQDRLL